MFNGEKIMNHLYQAPKPLLLIVDDNRIDLELSTAVLGKYYNVVTANSGRNGLLLLARLAGEDLEARLPDGILSDFEMPEFDGDIFLEILRGVRTAEDTAARYFDGDRMGIDAIHRVYHGSLGPSARPVMLYSTGVDLQPYLDRGANGVLDKQLIKGGFDALVNLVAAHVPYEPAPQHLHLPVPSAIAHSYMTSVRSLDSGLLNPWRLGPKRHYDR